MELNHMLMFLQCIGACVLLRYVYIVVHFVVTTWLRPGKNLLHVFGRWAIVTGATDGIGKAIAMELAKKRMNVLLISRTQSRLEEVKKEIEGLYPKVQVDTLAIDCAQMNESARNMVKSKIAEIKDVGVLINNVGVSYEFPEFFAELTDNRVEALINLNISCSTWMTKLVLPGMADRKRGCIVNLSSGSARLCVPLLSQYSASKRYMEQFTTCLAAEYAHKGVSIQCHTPMFVTTKLAKIRHASFFVPSPKVYAAAAVRNFGYETLCSPYWPHALQIFLLSHVPDVIMSKIAMGSHMSLRKRALKKMEKKAE